MNVYFARCRSHAGMIKIGVSNDVDKRLRQLSTGNPHHIYLMFSINMNSEKRAKRAEKQIHHMFRYCRGAGEWFTGDKFLLIFIGELKEGFDYRLSLDRAYVNTQKRRKDFYSHGLSRAKGFRWGKRC